MYYPRVLPVLQSVIYLSKLSVYPQLSKKSYKKTEKGKSMIGNNFYV